MKKYIYTLVALVMVVGFFSATPVAAKGGKPPKDEPVPAESQEEKGNKPERVEYGGTYENWDGSITVEEGWYQTHTIRTGNGLVRFTSHSTHEYVFTNAWGYVTEGSSKSHYRSVTDNGVYVYYSSHGWNEYENADNWGVYRYQCTSKGCRVTFVDNGEKTKFGY